MFIIGRLILKGSSTSEQAAGVLSQWLQVLNRVDQVSRVDKVNSAYQLCHDRYVNFVCELDPQSLVWPVHHVFVRLFLVFMFFRNCMSSASLANYLSQMKSCQLEKGFPWLDEPARFAVRKTMRSLAKMSLKKGVTQKAPMTLAKFRLLAPFLNLTDIIDLQFDALSRTCHNGLLRSGEGVKIRTGDLSWSFDRRTVRVSVRDSKANKTGPVEIVELTDWGPESAVWVLRTLYDVLSLWEVTDNRLVFDFFSDKRKFVDKVKALVALAGLDGDYAGHSFRSGGACDLYASNVPIEAIMRMGRWKSQAALLYLRCETVTALKIASALKFSCEHGCDFWESSLAGMGGS